MPVPMPPKVFETLTVLVASRGRLVSKDELMARLWPETFVEEATLARNISDLRKALGDSASAPRYIETVPKVGYRFIAGVSELHGEQPLIVEKHSMSRIVVEDRVANTLSPRSIAVLPFKSLEQDSSAEYLGLGLADALITRLSNIRTIVVRPTSAVLKYTGVSQDAVSIGTELSVQSVLEGSMQRSGDRIRVTVQVVDVQDGTSVWAARFDEMFVDIFLVEDSISEQVTRALSLQLTGEEKGRLAKRYTEIPGAYQLYLKGRFFWYRRTEEALSASLTYFEQAIELDPEYAAAYDGVADVYALLALRGILPAEVAFQKAKAAALQALQIDDGLAEAHASLAHVRLHDWDWAGLEEEFLRALDLNPGFAMAYGWYSEYLMAMGRAEECIAITRRAQQADPVSPVIATTLATALYFARRYDEAVQELRNAIEIDPNHFLPHFRLGQVHQMRGVFDEAISEMRKAVAFSGGSTETLSGLAQASAAAGQIDLMQTVLDQMNDQAAGRYVSPYNLAKVYASLCDKEEAFRWLEKAFRERNPDFIEIKVEPVFDSLRPDPRFQQILDRVGLP
jgi:TolB-like protein/Tfp pilus assembly protein PilF